MKKVPDKKSGKPMAAIAGKSSRKLGTLKKPAKLARLNRKVGGRG